MKPSFYGMAVIAMLLLSCGRSENKEVADAVAPNTQITHEANAKAAEIPLQSGTPQAADWDKKIIKTAQVTAQLKDYAVFDNYIHKNLRSFGAYISSEKQEHSEYQLHNTLSIKVPVEQFDNLLNSLSGEGIKITEKSVTTDDVTGETFDVKARLEAKKQVRERYLALLKQAGNMKEILSVQQEINTIQEQIESANGRLSYLVHQSAYSTVNLTYFQLLGTPTDQDTKPSFFTRMISAFTESFDGLGSLLLFLITLWPLWLGITGTYLVYRKRKQLRKSI